ncbi:MAG: 4Fe-4S binding protein [Schaedlerella sp.]|uniref:4Fe-4S binding protein n=1 Tax=Schaedlerella sp. TaxID=2676057 RepID=UPI002634BB03|nr:4Fe-4S binding protein [uncultured Schaedlerella sp.]
MDLSTRAAGLVFNTPLLPGSGPLTGTDERMIYLAKQGIGAIVTKTIAPKGAAVERPCIAGKGNMIFNSEAWSEYGSDVWLERFLPNTKKEVDTPIIASVGYDEADMKYLIPLLNPLVSGFEYIPRYVGKDFEEVGNIVRTIRAMTKLPLWVKMNANIPDPVGFAKACRDHGAQGIVAVTSLGPNMVIDIKNRRPLIGTADGFVWTSGPAIKPLAVAYVNMIKEAYPELSVIASGGCASAEDIVEFLLAGADAVQMLSEAMMKGRDTYGKILEDLPKVLEKYGFTSIEDVKSTKLEKKAGALEPSYPAVDAEKCTGCGICQRNCPYFAMEMRDGKPCVDVEKCFGCGLCESKCPVNAIKNVIQ